ncbi:VOC family protein [Ilumatobacter sp.]|uniref:VOC family protein n=1 Tax=Ilumatobacter sp. TaxID=1967498 RepID=UPI003C67E1E5
MNELRLSGIYSIKVPVRDVERSRTWYQRTFGYVVDVEFPDDDGVVRGIAGHLVGVDETFLALRADPALAEQLRGSNLFNLGVSDDDELDRWVTRLDDLMVAHSPKIDATIGRMVIVTDPDGFEIHLYSREHHGLDQSNRSGYGRRVISHTDQA